MKCPLLMLNDSTRGFQLLRLCSQPDSYDFRCRRSVQIAGPFSTSPASQEPPQLTERLPADLRTGTRRHRPQCSCELAQLSDTAHSKHATGLQCVSSQISLNVLRQKLHQRFPCVTEFFNAVFISISGVFTAVITGVAVLRDQLRYLEHDAAFSSLATYKVFHLAIARTAAVSVGVLHGSLNC